LLLLHDKTKAAGKRKNNFLNMRKFKTLMWVLFIFVGLICMSAQQNKQIALLWFDAFNRHHIEDLLKLYEDEAQHYSPKLKLRHPETKGLIMGKAALRVWWKDAFERLPDLHYEVKKLTADDELVFMEYTRQVPGEEDLQVGEVLEIKNNQIIFSRVYHG
jgi:predicted SnoaL-like aldol condensation-catalyzing enzyme